MKSPVALLAILMLAGCAAMQAPTADSSFAFAKHADAPVGILAGTISSDNAGNFESQDFYLFFASVDDPKASYGRLSINDHCGFLMELPDFDKPCGRVFAIELKPGTYSLQRWMISRTGNSTEPLRWYGPKFTIQAGKVTYVGEIRMMFDDSIPGAGADGWRGWPHASDQRERDLPVLYKHVPGIQQAEVLVQVLNLPPPSFLCLAISSGPLNGSGLDCRPHEE